MAKQDVVSKGVSDLQAAELQATTDFLGGFYDKVVSDQPVQSGGGLSQSDIDAAVKAAVDPLNAQIASLQSKDATDAKAASDAQASLSSAQAELATVQAQVVDLTGKLAADDAAVKGLQSSMDALKSADAQLQAVLSALAGLAAPAPVVPVAPVDPSNPPPAA